MNSIPEEQLFDQRDKLNSGFILENWLVEPLKGTLTPQKASQNLPELSDGENTHPEILRLEPKVMDVLLCLAANSGAVVRRDQLLEEIWGDVVVSEEVLTRCISELRGALGDNEKTRQFIQTLPKRGYRLLKPVHLYDSELDPAVDSSLSLTPDPEPIQSAAPEQAVVPDKPAAPDTLVKPAQKEQGNSDSSRARNLIPGLLLLTVVLCAFVLYGNRTANPATAGADGLVENPTTASQLISSTEENIETRSTILTGGAEHTVAVLPFVNLSGDEATDSFANGLTADIRNTLVVAAGGEIPVVARTSSEAFRGKAIDIRSIGLQLGAGRIVEGTVRIAAERVRVTAQITNSISGFPEWADRFEYDLNDGLQIQSAIADRIAAQLIPDDSPLAQSSYRQTDLKAYDYYLLGRHQWNRRTVESLQLAQQHFQQALDIDPDYTLAMSGLADSLILELEYSDQHRDDHVNRARQLVDKALRLQPNLAEAHASQGIVSSYRNADLPAAEAAYRRAVALKPGYAMARMWLGNVLLDDNRVTEAAIEYAAALRFDPLNNVVRSNHLRGLSLQGNYEAAGKMAAQYFAEDSGDPLLKIWMHNILSAGHYDQLLQFAVRHSFSAEYAGYGTEMVIEALVYLQRYDEAETLYRQFAADSGQSAKAWHLARLASNVQDSQTLREAAALIENDTAEDNPFKDCKGSLGSHWRGIASYIDGDYPAAARHSESALEDTQSKCMRELTRRAEITAYLSEALKRSGSAQQAEDMASQMLTSVEDSLAKGRGGLDIAVAKLLLLLTLEDQPAVRAQLQSMDQQNWQFYARLTNMPLLNNFSEELQPLLEENASKFKEMRETSRDIGLTKFGL